MAVIMDTLIEMLFTTEEQELYVLDSMAYLMFVMAACLFLIENMPYGRYASSRFGFSVNVKLAWFVQELPAFLVPLCLVVWTSPAKTSQLPNQLLMAMYLCHYSQRSLIYPFLIQGSKGTPFASFLSAFFFCTYNGYMQIRYLSHYAEYPTDWITHPCFIIGFGLWLVGWLMNIHSDQILRNLRKPGETDYKIPVGGMFAYVSGANFLGEIIEWVGFALAGWSVHSVSFATFTLVGLSLRALSHHKWYRTKFEDYPQCRKALIPFVL